ncbi:MAG: mandelate racemase/muconate lactonizing enzyme family protein [Runella sp.]
MKRRNFLKNSLLGATILPSLSPFSHDSTQNTGFEQRDLTKIFADAVKIEAVELLKTQGELMLVVRANGQMGITQCNDRMQHLVSLLRGLVLPHFVDKDARELPQLVDNAYRLNSNYKYAGMPLWNCIGSVEIATWDLLGRLAQQPVYQLIGQPVRSEYGVYISDWNREGDPIKIANQLLEKLQATGAKGVKIKIGGRMVNTPENAAQTRRYVPTLRKILSDDITIYADANGSYTPQEGIEAGKLLEDNGVAIFEEPCNFEDEDGMRQVTATLQKIVLAGGEQDSSIFRFERLAKTKVYDLLQPDLYYNGGILRALQVAEIAQKHGAVGVAPHSPKADPLIAPFWQVAALAPNLYGLQEFVYNLGQKPASWHTKIKAEGGKVQIPNRPGLGIEYDSSIWKSAEKVV